jgi:hypothetical protein
MTAPAEDLFDGIANFSALLAAARRASLGKRRKGGPAAFLAGLETEILRLEDELLRGSYRPGRYVAFEVRETTRRIVSAAPFRDRVVHHAFCAVVEPLFERGFIHHSYANRVARGLHFPGDDLFEPYRRRRGLPMGNLTSQFFANVYLDRLDHFATEVLRAPYLRYVDDFALFSDDSGQLAEWQAAIAAHLGRRRGKPARPLARPACSAAAPGTTIQGGCAWGSATGTAPETATTISVFGWPVRSRARAAPVTAGAGVFLSVHGRSW